MGGDASGQDRGVRPVAEVLARLDGIAARDRLALDDVIEAFGDAAFLPILMVLALVVVSPLSGIPFLPTLFGLAIATVGAQAALGRERIHLPRWIGGRQVSGRRLRRALQRLRGAADWVDRRARPRFSALVHAPFDLVPKLAIVPCGLAMPFLELVPFSSSILAGAVLLFATALLTRDGLFVLAGLALLGLGASIPVAVLAGVIGGF